MTGWARGEAWELLPVKLYLNTAAPAVFVWFVVSVSPTSLLITEMMHDLGWRQTNEIPGSPTKEWHTVRGPFTKQCLLPSVPLLLKLMLEREV